jgi:hypothetical protein
MGVALVRMDRTAMDRAFVIGGTPECSAKSFAMVVSTTHAVATVNAMPTMAHARATKVSPVDSGRGRNATRATPPISRKIVTSNVPLPTGTCATSVGRVFLADVETAFHLPVIPTLMCAATDATYLVQTVVGVAVF